MMKTKIISPIGLSPTGVGPKIFRPTILVLFLGIIGGIFFPSVSMIPFVKTDLNAAGWIWLTAGVAFWLCAVIQFLIQFPKGKLITTGIYSLSRNPIYASWIVFILPGIAGICNNWIFLSSALVMYIVLQIYIKEEEKVLNEIFGEEYEQYYNKVGRVLFFPPII